MKYQKLTKYEKKDINREKLKEALHGEGLYLYQNNTNAEMTLPRPTKSGLKKVAPRGQFQGDDYYMQLVREGLLRHIQTLMTPEQERQSLLQEENSNMGDKLILDQPDTITEQGKVDHVVGETPLQNLNEGDNDAKPDVLINEAPANDGFIIVGE